MAELLAKDAKQSLSSWLESMTDKEWQKRGIDPDNPTPEFEAKIEEMIKELEGKKGKVRKTRKKK